jgi:glycosyltransferase involved in cell wall biosynthesis
MSLVTVYITNYNYAEYIDNAVESVLNQTYNDIEILIIDDGSTDNSLEIIEKYQSKPNIKIISQKNKGLNVTNNIALHASNGEFIIRLDADDWLDSNAIEILVRTIERDPHIGLVFPDYYNVDKNGTILELVRRHDFTNVTLFDSPAHGACTMVRKSFLQNLGGYNELYKCQDGVDLWLKFLGRHKISNVNLPLFYYRHHGSNLTSNKGHILETRSKILNSVASSKVHKRSKVNAIVPIRGNVLDERSRPLDLLGKRRLIDWTIYPLVECQDISTIFIVSSDREILDYVSLNFINTKVKVVERPKDLSYINVSITETIKYVLDKFEINISDKILQVTIDSPFRTAQIFSTIIDTMDVYNTDIVIPVFPDTDIFYTHNGVTLQSIIPERDIKLKLEREDLYREVGSMRLYRSRKFLNQKFECKIGHVILDQISSFKIRTQLDWNLAELMAVNSVKN